MATTADPCKFTKYLTTRSTGAPGYFDRPRVRICFVLLELVPFGFFPMVIDWASLLCAKSAPDALTQVQRCPRVAPVAV